MIFWRKSAEGGSNLLVLSVMISDGGGGWESGWEKVREGTDSGSAVNGDGDGTGMGKDEFMDGDVDGWKGEFFF